MFLIEAGIAVFVDDNLVRPYLGDSLAVVLVYLAIRAASRLGVLPSAASASAIACAIEFGQYFGLVRFLSLDDVPLARVVLGTGFDPKDFIAYAAGFGAVLAGETTLRRMDIVKSSAVRRSS